MKNKKILYLALSGIATAGLGYLIFSLLRKKPKTFSEALDDTLATVVNAPSEVVAVVSNSYKNQGFPLKKGSGGKRIKALQEFLNLASGYNLVVDGKFGNLTESAVLSEQAPFDVFKGMHPDAIKGQVTESFYNSNVKSFEPTPMMTGK